MFSLRELYKKELNSTATLASGAFRYHLHLKITHTDTIKKAKWWERNEKGTKRCRRLWLLLGVCDAVVFFLSVVGGGAAAAVALVVQLLSTYYWLDTRAETNGNETRHAKTSWFVCLLFFFLCTKQMKSATKCWTCEQRECVKSAKRAWKAKKTSQHSKLGSWAVAYWYW